MWLNYSSRQSLQGTALEGDGQLAEPPRMTITATLSSCIIVDFPSRGHLVHNGRVEVVSDRAGRQYVVGG